MLFSEIQGEYRDEVGVIVIRLAQHPTSLQNFLIQLIRLKEVYSNT